MVEERGERSSCQVPTQRGTVERGGQPIASWAAEGHPGRTVAAAAAKRRGKVTSSPLSLAGYHYICFLSSSLSNNPQSPSIDTEESQVLLVIRLVNDVSRPSCTAPPLPCPHPAPKFDHPTFDIELIFCTGRPRFYH